ncbi:T9SS type B sorting domain-containing protein [Lacinutrix algicola]|uniref:T9SS type B sorting domain-containing protein n=1 Tax=Lacinutrix algicola TaxID=342954 RepID=UPI000A4E1530|nr:T9SS type B sorting domain-containing protein [Lacinutrix algicola]
MKKNYYFSLLLLLLCTFAKAQSVNTSYLCLANGDIVLADFSTCSTTVVATHYNGFFDISQGDTNDTLYGIRDDALFRINTATGVITDLGTITPIGFNGAITITSLVKESTGVLLGVNTDAPGELFRINVANMTANYLGDIGYGSAGDLTYFEGILYLSANGNKLVDVDVNTPSNSTLVGDITTSSGLSNIFGVVTIITQNPCSIDPDYQLIATGGNDSAILDVNAVQANVNCNNITSSTIYGASEVASDTICSTSLILEEDVTMSTSPEYCIVASTQLNATPDPITPLGTYSYEWVIDGTTTVIGTNSTLSININSTTTYNCTVTDSGKIAPDNIASDSITVTINQAPTQSTIECWETATFNNTTCTWDVSGTQPAQPTNLECWETATFNNTTCLWEISGTQPAQPTTECWETVTFNNTTCTWNISGTQPTQPANLECWENATFNNTTCTWDISGTQPAQPTNLECWENVTFNNTSCTWETTGTQPTQPTTACWETATFNTISCSWDVTGTQPAQPTNLECWEIATLNQTTCLWEVSGTQATQPTTACWETSTFNTTSCSWDVTGTPPVQPITECWETATLNSTTCVWEVSGTQPMQPTTACWETATFNTTSCTWEISGSQATQPTTTCWETATFNTTSCSWTVSGTQPPAPTNLECWETATFNNTTCTWDLSGTQTITTNDIYLTFCEGETLTLDASTTITNAQYLWSTSEQTASIEVSSPGIYNLEATDGCSTEVTNFTVTTLDSPIIANVVADNFDIIVTTSSDDNYHYSLDGFNYQTSNVFTNMPNGLYTVYVKSLECNFVVTLQYLHFYVPQFFTPNGDNFHDYFELNDLEYFGNTSVTIFNRFGKLLFSARNRSVKWDGTLNGALLPSSDYWYLITINDQEFKGHFTLKR